MKAVKPLLHILTPVYNDWESLQILIQEIEKIEELSKYNMQMLVIDDGSNREPSTFPQSKSIQIEVIHLKINVGHQRSIAIGLQYLADNGKQTEQVIVMDCDGEDRPSDIPHLLKLSNKHDNKKLIFAKRQKRNESFFFRFSYSVYKFIFQSLTGFSINYGNFSCIPDKLLQKLVYKDTIWNHYAASIIQSKIPYDTILLDRGKRYAGQSKMNLNSLILHGLSAVSIYFDIFTLRILKASFGGIIMGMVFILFVLYQKLITGTAIPGWASSLILIISGIILQLFSVTIIVVLLQLSRRKSIVAPNRQLYKDFILSIETSKNL
jgi:hypothetical protein